MASNICRALPLSSVGTRRSRGGVLRFEDVDAVDEGVDAEDEVGVLLVDEDVALFEVVDAVDEGGDAAAVTAAVAAGGGLGAVGAACSCSARFGRVTKLPARGEGMTESVTAL